MLGIGLSGTSDDDSSTNAAEAGHSRWDELSTTRLLFYTPTLPWHEITISGRISTASIKAIKAVCSLVCSVRRCFRFPLGIKRSVEFSDFLAEKDIFQTL